SVSPTEGFCARSAWKIRFASFPPYILLALATLASLVGGPPPGQSVIVGWMAEAIHASAQSDPLQGVCARSAWKICFASFPPYILLALATLASLVGGPPPGQSVIVGWMADATHAPAQSGPLQGVCARSAWKICFASFPPYIHRTFATLASLVG